MAVKAKDKLQQKVIDEAWLHLPDWYDEDSAFNPLLNFPESSKENPHIFIIWLMSNPEYFAFFCKYILNFELLPMQLVILQEMWYRKFPMLIGSRGLGKCVKNGRILTDSKVCKIEDIVPEDYPELQRYYPEKDILVFGENGFNKVEYAWKNPKEKTVKIKTDYRYKLEGTQHHPIRVVRDGEIVWKEMSELKLGDIVPIDRTPSWITKPNDITPDVAYWMGALVGDGGYTSRKAISFTNQDKEVVDLINKTFIKLYGKGLTPRGSKGFEYQICAVNIWDDLFSKYGFGSPICEEKDVPSTILASSKECVAMFLRGLMDTDGYVEKNGASLQLSAKSPYIIYNVQFLLTRFGIISKVRKSWNKKYQRYYYKLDISGDNIDIYIKEIGFTIDYKKDRLALTSKTRNTNKDVIPHALVLKDLLSLRDKYAKIRKPTPRGNNYERKLITPSRLKKYEISYLTLSKILEITKDCSHEKEWIRLKDIFDKHYFYDEIVEIKSGFSETYDVHIPNDHSFISNGFISHNTSLMAIYTILRLLFLPKRKVVVAGASFRQSKLVFEYMETIWNNSPVLRDLCGPNQGPIKDVDMYKFRILDSVAYFLPIGDGSKIRGLRANDILIDEFASHQKEIFETVISGFGAVSSAPLDNVRLAAAKRKAEELGVWEEDVYESKLQAIPNQIILSGTAYYDFNHFADYWKSWHKIIESRGDKEKLIQALGGPDKYNESLSHTHFSIMRIPFEIIPEGFMDAAQVARSRATFDSGTYTMEFGACVNGDTEVITDCGVKLIKNLRHGDMVLGHRGKFEKVIKVTKRKYTNKILSVKNYGSFNKLLITTNHPVWQGEEEWVDIGESQYMKLINLQSLSGLVEIDVEDYVSDYLIDDKDYIYPMTGRSRFNNQEIQEIRASSLSQTKLGEIYGAKQSVISSIINRPRKRTKGGIPCKIKLDYNFGLIIGYYAAEGSTSKKKTLVEFALDGHVNTKLEDYISELNNAIIQVFNIVPKNYNKEENLKVIGICSKMVGQLISQICPGYSDTKYVIPKILYSNEEFMKGFIRGYWSGDGHIPDKIETNLVSSSNSISLSSQIRVLLSYFNIFASLHHKPAHYTIIKGRKCFCKSSYPLNINSINKDNFLQIFYGKNPEHNIIRRKDNLIVVNNNHFTLKAKNRILKDYNDWVYNIEVENCHSYSLLNGTVHNCFSKDSNGFFKRSLIESCSVNPETNFSTMPEGLELFEVTLHGRSDRKYVYGIDPASEVDRFAIVILEIHNNHRRIVYCWTTNKKEFQARVKSGVTKENEYYSYCARKIRELMKRFPTDHIAIDSQGGGYAVLETLHDKDKINSEAGELPMWEWIDPTKAKDSDGQSGLHNIYMVNFSSADYTRDANHGLKADFENKVLLFPFFDSISLGEASLIDASTTDGITYDSLDDCIMDIEELKDELSSIVMTQTPSGREHWDTPEVKVSGSKKGRLRKDRYSALLMANMLARNIRPRNEIGCTEGGGFATYMTKKEIPNGPAFIGPAWFVDRMRDIYE